MGQIDVTSIPTEPAKRPRTRIAIIFAAMIVVSLVSGFVGWCFGRFKLVEKMTGPPPVEAIGSPDGLAFEWKVHSKPIAKRGYRSADIIWRRTGLPEKRVSMFYVDNDWVEANYVSLRPIPSGDWTEDEELLLVVGPKQISMKFHLENPFFKSGVISRDSPLVIESDEIVLKHFTRIAEGEDVVSLVLVLNR